MSGKLGHCNPTPLVSSSEQTPSMNDGIWNDPPPFSRSKTVPWVLTRASLLQFHFGLERSILGFPNNETPIVKYYHSLKMDHSFTTVRG